MRRPNPGANPEAKTMLPHAAPDSPFAALLLFGVRRMAAHGLNDAIAAQAMIGGFGAGFRRPLVLLRAFMAEAARVSSTRMLVAPCCCARMTVDERALLDGIATAIAEPARAHRTFTELMHVRSALGLVTSAQALNASFADRGMMLAAFEDAA